MWEGKGIGLVDRAAKVIGLRPEQVRTPLDEPCRFTSIRRRW